MVLSNKSYIIANRFGFGVDPKNSKQLNRNPYLWVKNQLNQKETDTPYIKSLASSSDLNKKLLAVRATKDRNKIKAVEKSFRKLFANEIKQRTLHAINTNCPFLERLTYFWSNHFTVSVQKRELFHLAGAFEREAIRPNILGDFSDLLINAIMHPAMLVYLDNIRSFGPNSKRGINRKKGLNENLAREILELHSLGVDGGYVQEDVIALAKLITGWTVANRGEKAGQFSFAKNAHEPGVIEFFGRHYENPGFHRGKAALKYIANHPKTAEHIARKLVIHFISEDAPEAIVKKIKQTFIVNSGDLKKVYLKLAFLGNDWASKYSKVKTNQDLIISLGRAATKGLIENNKYYFNSFKFLGNSPFSANSPAGYSDLNSEILNSRTIMRRLEWAELAGAKVQFDYPPEQLSKIILGNHMSEDTFNAIKNAPSKRYAYAILFASPEFQRR